MENEVILKKIESLSNCIKRLEDKCPKNVDLLKKDIDLQDIINLNLERAVQISVDIASITIAEQDFKTAETMAGCFSVLEENNIIDTDLSRKLQCSVGFRNISVHEYQKIDLDIIYDIITNSLENFKKFIQAILELH